MNDNMHAELRQAFQNANTILITSHIRPDGDAVGSVLGLGLSLMQIGKKTELVLADGVPGNFRYLTGSDQIKKRAAGNFDLSVVVDSGDLPRIGHILDGVQPDINIDHHVTNQNFARINLVDPESAATSAILAEFIPQWGLPINVDVANALLTGVIVDTIGFRTSNVSAKTLRIAANLMDIGANLPEQYHRGLIQRSLRAARYWGAGLQKIETSGRLLWTSLTLEDRKITSYHGNDDADLVNMLSTIENMDVVIIFVEQKDQHVKVSWRSQNGMDVSQIALHFKGGGHPAAAGADIPGKLEEVKDQVIKKTSEILISAEKGSPGIALTRQ
jgi:bifunctional oligoribonuclease and PAP phosphatase NrnA